MTSKKFIATIASLAMMVTGFSAAQAKAMDGDDLAKILLGATALVVVGKAIHSNKNDKPSHATPSKPPHVTTKKLPNKCSKTFKTHNERRVAAYETNCLHRERVNVRQLPQQCRVTIREKKATHKGFETHCLQRKGYRVSWK